MNQQQSFDDHIKDRFSGYRPPVPEGTWEKIAARRGKRKPAGLWFLFNRSNLLVLCVLLAGGSGAWFYKNYKNREQQQNIIALEENNKSKENNTNQSTTETTTNSNTVAMEPGSAGSNTAAPATGDNIAATGNGTSSTSPTGNNKLNPATTSGTRNIETRLKQQTTNSNTGTGSPSLNTTAKRTLTPGKDDAAAFTKTNRRVTDKGKRKISISASSPVEEKEEEEEAGEDPVVAAAIPAAGSLWRRLRGEAERAGVAQRAKQKPPIPLLNAIFLPGCPTIEKNASGNKKYFEIYAGPDYTFRNFSDTGNSAYLQKRKETTSYSSAYSAGIRYTKVFNNSMSIRTGFNFSQINEKFSLVQGNVVHVVYIINNHGDTTGSYSTTGTRIKTTHNKYRSVDIPLTIGYELGNGRWHANINAGAMINIYSWQKGEVVDSVFRPVSITTGKSEAPYQFRTNTGIGFLAGVSVYYRISNNWHLMAEPWFRYNLSPMNKENITLKQKYHTLGLKLGIRIDIP